MKRGNNDLSDSNDNNNQFTGNNINFSSYGGGSSSSNLWPQDLIPDDDDELFAVLGYNLKSSDMEDVASKIQQLEQVMEQPNADLATDTTHYNPSDLSNYLQSMLSGFDLPDPDPFLFPPDDIITTIDSGSASQIDFGSDLLSVPGEAVYPPNNPPPLKKLKSAAVVIDNNNMNMNMNMNIQPDGPDPALPVVMVDSQENGVILVHTLMACAEAVQQGNLKYAESLLKSIGFLAISQPGPMRKVATYFAEALARRIYGLYPPNLLASPFIDVLQMHFYETCPYLKFAHFTANQAILEAFVGKTKVHVIDFSMKQGMQWPALLQALALRPGGPPKFRLTGVGPPSIDNTDHLQGVGWKLARFAETINIEFEYRGFVANSLADLRTPMFDVQEDETVALNSVFELHQMLARTGAIERVLQLVKDLNPEIVTVVEQEANHNESDFLERFTQSLHYYSTLFDSLESGNSGVHGGSGTEQDKVMSEVYLGRQICNIVAAEGPERVERHETLTQWRARFETAGFESVNLGSIAYKQASTLLALFAGGGGYRVEENNGSLMLGWHSRPLIATSAWKPVLTQ